MADEIFGLNHSELLEVNQKLNVLGLDLKDVIEFLDRDKIQLFAELKSKIKFYEKRLKYIREQTESIKDLTQC